MDSKISAIKNHMLKSRGLHPKAISVGKSLDPDSDKDLGDKAPPVKDKAEEGEMGENHLSLMKDLVSQISHPGRAPMSLNEKANDTMKEKMASMVKHKKSI